jgi:MFS family permease
MGWEQPTRGCSGGGESIPPVRTIHLWLGATVIALLLAGGLATYPALRAGTLAWAVLPLAVLAVVCVAVAVVLRGRLTGVALFLLAAEYVVVEAADRAGPLSVVAYAVGLIMLCELLLWSGQLPRKAAADRAIVTQRVLTLGLIALAAALLALVTLAAAGLRLGGSIQGALVGVAAAIVALLLPLLLVRTNRVK